MRLKYDYPPLLGPGRHCMTLAELERLCVHSVADRDHREKLYYSLEELVQRFLRENIACEFWVDGSFVTEKPDPSDVDVIIKIDLDVMSNLTQAQRLLVDSANEEGHIAGVDSFVFTAYPRGHAIFGTELDDIDDWARQYGVENGDVYLKGFIVLLLGETDVGLRIRR